MSEFRNIQLSDVRLRAAVRGDGPLVVMVHGFPKSWYSWRHQMKPIADAGFTACAIDVRGYGGSDKPPAVADYAMERMIADVIGVIEALSADGRGILIGHDWGAPIVWNSALVRPDRVRAVCGLSVPYLGPASRPFTEIFDEIFTKRGRFFYQAYFQKVGEPEAEAEADPRAFLRKFYSRFPVTRPMEPGRRTKRRLNDCLTVSLTPNPSQRGFHRPISTTTWASSSSPDFADRSTAIAITNATLLIYAASRTARLPSPPSSSAAIVILPSTCWGVAIRSR